MTVIASVARAAAVVLALAGAAPGQCELPPLAPADAAPLENFGNAVALDGATAIVGAHYDGAVGPLSGAAYVLERGAAGWGEVVKLLPAEIIANDRFGFAVGLSGDIAIVGARYRSDFGYGSGAAYVFERGTGDWSKLAKLANPEPAIGDFFGHAVAIAGTTVAIGAPNDDGADFDTGSVFVFVKVGANWTFKQKLTSTSSAVDDRFGYAVAADGNTIMVGATGSDDLGEKTGAVHVFVRTGGVFHETEVLIPSSAASGDAFGSTIALAGGRAVIASVFGDGTGVAYVYERQGAAGAPWLEVAALRPADGAADDYFGQALALDGDWVLAGSLAHDAAGDAAGAAYLYRRGAGGWAEAAKLAASGGAAGDNFGTALGLDQDSALVAATGVAKGAGAVYGFDHVGAIATLGPGCGGAVPALSIAGCPVAGTTLRIRVEHGPRGEVLVLVAGAAETALPLPFGCIAYAGAPVAASLPLVLPAGPYEIDLALHAGSASPGASVVLQAFVASPGTLPPSASNGVRVSFP